MCVGTGRLQQGLRSIGSDLMGKGVALLELFSCWEPDQSILDRACLVFSRSTSQVQQGRQPSAEPAEPDVARFRGRGHRAL